jgi:two-component system sensor histidine kinase ChiS
VWVSVRDTGIGIPPSKHERIFDRFYQVEPSLTRRFEGMGLGLSIAKGMVELHGGRIWVESVEEMGSAFTFALPLLEG